MELLSDKSTNGMMPALTATRGKLRMKAVNWKQTRKRAVKAAWKIISGKTNWLSLLHRSIGFR